jgi:hypothetical protein
MPQLIYNDLPGALPASYTVPPGGSVQLESIAATFDGAGAAGPFLACVAAYSQDGKLVGRWFPSTQFAAGDSGEVSYGPFLGDDSAEAASSPIIGRGVFSPAGGLVAITSTNANAPTAIVDAPSFTADGVTVYRVDFFVPTVDIQVTGGGTGTSLNVQCLRNGGSLGVFGNYNVRPQAGNYGSTPMFLSIFDTPPAGATVYGIAAFKGLSGGAAANMAVYGDLAAFPNPTLSAPGYVAVYSI